MTFGKGREARPWDVAGGASKPSPAEAAAVRRATRAEKALEELQQMPPGSALLIPPHCLHALDSH